MATWRSILRAMVGVFVGAAIGAALAFLSVAAMHGASYDAAGVAILIAAILVYWGRKSTPKIDRP